MPWPIPAPGDISNRGAAVYEGIPALEGIDARSPNTVATANCRVTEMSVMDLYLFQAYCAQELMVDTAQDTLDRHAAIWGVPQLQPTAATGNAIFTAAAGAPVSLPAGEALSASGGVIITTNAAETIPAGTSLSVPVTVTVAGSAGNLPAGTVFDLVSPFPGLNPQSATLDTGGLSGGTDIEATEAWRARIIARIQTPPNGGATADYKTWAKQANDQVAYVSVIPAYVGLGTVGVIIAMAGPRAATVQEVAGVQAYMNIVKPVDAYVTVVAASLQPVNFTLQLNPDSTATRAAALAGLTLAFQQDAQIGGEVYMSRVDNAISSTSGEYSHERTAPTADVAMTSTELPVLGAITWIA